MNAEINGIALSSAIHHGSHPQYDARVQKHLDKILEDNPEIRPEDALKLKIEF